jgi:cobaltochelatase CobN
MFARRDHGAVQTHHFDPPLKPSLTRRRAFIRTNNRYGYIELLKKFEDARHRGY